ncbi:MAG: hypothetical protein ACYTG1_09835 [Planctomycetota bacterium]
MRAKPFLAVAVLLAVAAGCSAVQHQHQPYRAAGTDLPVEVTVKHEAGEPVQGTVHHRSAGSGAYDTVRMELRGDQLWTMLPTSGLEPEAEVEYYIDVDKAGELHTLGSPGAPYVVTFLDQDGMILSSLRDRPVASDSDHPVRIVLHAKGEPIGQPMAVYLMPGIPGEIRAPMEHDGRGNYLVTIPPTVVRAGTWKYMIEVPINGTTYRFPENGFRTFAVKAALARPAVATGEPR